MKWCCALVAWALVAGVGLAGEAPEARPGLEARPAPEARLALRTPNKQTVLLHRLLSQDPRLTPRGLYSSVIRFLKYLKNHKDAVTCMFDLWTVLNATKGGIDEGMWAIKMLDASTKFIPSGLVQGNIMDLGQFDECVNTGFEDIKGQHCLLSLNFHFYNLSPDNELNLLGGSLTLTMAYCMPHSCHPELLDAALKVLSEDLTKALAATSVNVTAYIDDKDCYTIDPPPYDALDIAVLCIVVLILGASSAATIVDYYLIFDQVKNRDASTWQKIIQAFSMYSNGLKLFSTKQNEEQMSCINGMKFLSIGWVVWGHRYRYLAEMPIVNFFRLPEMIETWSHMTVVHAILSVDTFFLISGLLNCYGICIVRDKVRRFNFFNILHLYVHRYIRLTPAYLLMIGMTATLQYHVGDGPMWNRFSFSAKMNCREGWWANLLYLNNYLTAGHTCMMQSWYLAADMQMFFFSPFVVLTVWKWPKIGYALLALLSAASVAAPFAVAYVYDIQTTIPVSLDPKVQSMEMEKLYLPTHVKTISYVVGTLFGYLLYRMRVKKDMSLNISWVTATILWILAILSMCYAVFGGHYLYLWSRPYTLVESSLFIGFYRLFWSLGVGWTILACCQGYGGMINNFLSLKIFGPLGRLTYCIYLTHIFMILYKVASTKQPMYLSDYIILTDSLGELPIIMVFAVLLALTTESPIVMIEKMVFKRERGQKTTRNVEQKRKNSVGSLVAGMGEMKGGPMMPVFVVSPEPTNHLSEQEQELRHRHPEPDIQPSPLPGPNQV